MGLFFEGKQCLRQCKLISDTHSAAKTEAGSLPSRDRVARTNLKQDPLTIYLLQDTCHKHAINSQIDIVVFCIFSITLKPIETFHYRAHGLHLLLNKCCTRRQ